MDRGIRKERVGVVLSNKMDRTVVVKVVTRTRHPRYRKVFDFEQKFYAHDESNALQVGNTVRMVETRPLSKTKRWRVVEVLS